MNVFISSTYVDCIEYRNAAIEVVESLKDNDIRLIGMELFGSRTETTLDVCLTEVRKADIYILIIAHRYGTVDQKTRKSYTQLEYEEVIKKSIPILVYILDDKVPVLPEYIDKDKKYKKLQYFKKIITTNHTYSSFKNKRQLKKQICSDLCRILKLENKNNEKIDFNDLEITPDRYNYNEYDIEFIVNFCFFREPKIKKIDPQIIENLQLAIGNTIGLEILIKKDGQYSYESTLLGSNLYATWIKEICNNNYVLYYNEEGKKLECNVYKAKVRYHYCFYKELEELEDFYITLEFSGFELLEKPIKKGVYIREEPEFIWD